MGEMGGGERRGRDLPEALLSSFDDGDQNQEESITR